jgi:L-lactate dehydrogenase complex protein LldG
MPDDRADIFATLRASLERLERRTPYPDYPADIATPAAHRGVGLDLLRERLTAANTLVIEGPDALAGFLQDRGACTGYCDPALAPRLAATLGSGIELHARFDRGRANAFEFGITRASAGILETGSLVLKDGDTSDRLGAVAPWIHVACLDPRRIYETLAEAIADLGDDPNVILVSGHSQTADVEGIMIHGVHGPGEQVCLLLEMEGTVENER